MANVFTVPPRIVTGAGALEKAAGLLASFGKKALLVTDGMMAVSYTHLDVYKRQSSHRPLWGSSGR